MSYRFARQAAASIFFWAAVADAQTETSVRWLKGELRGQSPTFSRYVIELDPGNGFRRVRAGVKPGGTFEFRDVPVGSYLLRVTNEQGDTVQEEFVTIRPQAPDLEVRLREPAITRPAGEGVSVRQLLHPPSAKAASAFLKAQKKSKAGQYESAAAELERAIRLSPDFAQAHTNLAAQYIRLHRPADAIAEARLAMEIRGPNPLDFSNIALAQSALQDWSGALASARRALELDRMCPAANWIAGTLLSGDPRTMAEAAEYLERASAEIPAARPPLRRVQEALHTTAFR